MKLDVFKIDGTQEGTSVELAEDVFGIEPNDHVIYLAVKAYLANQRQGTHKTKERNEVSGGGRKPWKQKGRGTARAGSTRSPIWIGGGTIFGPKPRNYRQKLNKKVSRLARKSALSYKASSEQIIIVEDFNYESPKTNEFIKMLDSLKISGKKTLLLTSEHQENIYKSGRNIDKVSILEAQKASTYDLLNHQVLLLQKSAVEKLVSVFN
ncbi:MAG: 50S ribosomal protein L4 [Ignavibacteriales bacterium CG18_big_fil_WC_8_21_14_2_50_31_20]|nr:MAG: 50S ribosomal protein L4 [Ignavibacteriales bacterium CG18_big_fil_WC_8_21_14_2_50_31_20]